MAAQIGVPPFFLDDVLVPARRMSIGALERSLLRLHQAERAFKSSSKVDPEIQLARLVRALADEDARGPGPRRRSSRGLLSALTARSDAKPCATPRRA